MPDEHGKLTDKETTRVSQWVQTKFPVGMSCSRCGGRDWEVNPQLVAMLPVNEKGAFTETGKTPLLVSMTCKQCAFVSNLNARAAEII